MQANMAQSGANAGQNECLQTLLPAVLPNHTQEVLPSCNAAQLIYTSSHAQPIHLHVDFKVRQAIV